MPRHASPAARALVGLLLLSVHVPQLAAQAAPGDSARIERVASLARLWGAVRYFHPELSEGGERWDSLVVEAIPRIAAAGDAAAYGREVGALLARLGDPATHLVVTRPQRDVPASAASARWAGGSVLVVAIPNTADFNAVFAVLREHRESLARARGVVFDLRARTSPAEGMEVKLRKVLCQIVRLLNRNNMDRVAQMG